MKYCDKCCKLVDESYNFCPDCSRSVNAPVTRYAQLVAKVTGTDMPANFRLKGFFSELFHKHSKAEQDEIFVAGTSYNTLKDNELAPMTLRPWLYSRVFAMLLLAFVMCYVCAINFKNANLLPGLIFIGALLVPFSFLILVFELNLPKNVSIFEVVKIFFIGGIASLICTLTFGELIGNIDNAFLDTVVWAGLEEIAKVIVVLVILRRANYKYILNGLLIGAAVGCGFAVFETAGYAFRYYISSGAGVMLDVIYQRGILSFGGHISWAAVEGAAIVLVKCSSKLRLSHVFSKRFLAYLAFTCALHILWNLQFNFLSAISGKHLVLCVLIMTVVVTLIKVGAWQVYEERANLNTDGASQIKENEIFTGNE